jgi:hypothetical protein
MAATSPPPRSMTTSTVRTGPTPTMKPEVSNSIFLINNINKNNNKNNNNNSNKNNINKNNNL